MAIAALFACSVAPSATSAQAPAKPPDLTRLETGVALHREMSGGQTHAFALPLSAGDYVHLVVMQRGIDVVVRLFDPQGKKVLEVDSPNGTEGPEPVFWVAEAAGDYRLEVNAPDPGVTPGKYDVEVNERRPATGDDRLRTEAERMFGEAVLLDAQGAPAKAIPVFREALDAFRKAHQDKRTAETLIALGDSLANAAVRKPDEALDCHAQALAIARALKDRGLEGDALFHTGIVYSYTKEFEKTIRYYNEALDAYREVKDQDGATNMLDYLGMIYRHLGEYEKAISYFEQVLSFLKSSNVPGGDLQACNTMSSIAVSYSDLSQYDKSIAVGTQELELARRIGNRHAQSTALNNMATDYTYLGQFDKAIDILQQLLPLAREEKNAAMEGIILGNLATAYTGAGRVQESIPYYEQSLENARQLRDGDGEATNLSNLARAYDKMGQYDKALDLCQQALQVRRAIRDRAGEGVTLEVLGGIHVDLGRHEEAAHYMQQALILLHSTKSLVHEAIAFAGLMDNARALNQPSLAIFYGKSAVNLYQTIRTEIHTLSPDTQKTFLKQHQTGYHTLAEILISQGRLPEAEQVLNLLKEEEYFDFVRRDSAEASSFKGTADLTPDEAEREKKYHEIGDHLLAIGMARGELLSKRNRTAEENARLQQFDLDVEAGNQQFQRFLDGLATQFAAKPEGGVRLAALRETQGIMEDLRDLPKGTVAIYTLVGEQKYRSILVTPDVEKAYEFSISGTDLDRKILEFRQAVENPRQDPRPLARELYNILLGNMANDLREAKAQTLMFSLDGTLRYLPLAALFDGQKYLLEQYRLTVFTPASNARLKEAPSQHWTAAGFGVTKAHEGTAPLPGVAQELAGIIKSAPRAKGVLPGVVKLDDEFTDQTWRAELHNRYPVVHVASHFHFQPGNETDSYLLLGDGSRLTLAQLKISSGLFGGVQLLTLSACNTGLGGSADGKEVEGFGVLAQRQGAKAVVASLWPVADTSTSVLMREFYRIRESGGGMTKAEALREAQLHLLRGSLGRQESSAETNRGVRTASPGGDFQPNTKAPYSHPYYWAPFFLMGNWL